MENNSTSTPNSKRPGKTAFKQQQLKAWQPILTPRSVIATFFAIGVIFIVIGVILLVASNNVIEYEVRYDNLCKIGSTCSFKINVDQTMTQPVFLYYKLENYYQNHRRYVSSRDDNQLRGEVVQSYSDMSSCTPVQAVNQSQYTSSDPPKQNWYYPCGLIAWSLFNDTFSLSSGNVSIPLRKKGIAWSTDVSDKYGNPPKGTVGTFIVNDFQDEDFIVWMRTAALPTFRKLYRIIDQDIKTGEYEVTFKDNYDVSSFGGKKYVVLSTVSFIGGKNPFLGICYLVVGCICFFQGLVFLIKHLVSPRKFGDARNFDWNS